ncbi:MBL fold metallo-hydrolase [Knoellia sp. CPCC 206453]|uniref:MBL fold metallo-hydrolase n=1 Tax=Knoellia pratensis TaxID=3404796 RepID=UPI00361F9BE9
MASDLVVQLAPGVWRIRLLRDYINGFIFRDDDGQVTLVDMGLKSHGPKVIAALEAIGSGTDDVTRLLLTHAHPDHAGGAAHVQRATGKPFGIHEDDAEFARSGFSPPRDNSLRIGALANRLMGAKQAFEPIEVGETFVDGQVVPVAGGLEVVHTPGHSPGHAAYLHRDSGVLITGDSIFNVRGLTWPVKAFCTNFVMTKQTAERLTTLDYSTAAFTHGAELRDNPRAAIGDFLARKRT